MLHETTDCLVGDSAPPSRARKTAEGGSLTRPWIANANLPRLRHFLYCDRIEERHLRAQLLAHNFDGMLGLGFAEGHELFAAGVLVGQEALGEAAILNLGQNLLHRFAALCVDDARAAHVIAPFGSVADGVA